MIKEYKLVNDFRGIPKGSIMTWDDKKGRYTYYNKIEDDNTTQTTYFAIDADTMSVLSNSGYAIAIENTCKECTKCLDCAKGKLGKIKALCDQVIATQDENLSYINEKYNNKEVPECVLLETETVHFNLVKVLNKILEIANEQTCKNC